MKPPRFFKGHGLGNDYLAIELASLPIDPAPAAVRLICDRHRGLGSDGLLARVPSGRADFGLRIYNPDGTEAEKSGNGLRIFGAFLFETGAVPAGARFSVETPGGEARLALLGRSADGVYDIEVEMGRASFRSAAVGMTGPDRDLEGEWLELDAGDRLAVQPVSLGNPHCVVFQDEFDPDDLRRRGPQIATHPWFPRGTNVQFARPTGPATLDVWVWERGAGETLASGSSACAVAAAAVRLGLVSERDLEVRMPGGTLRVTVGEDYDLVLRGPVEAVCWSEPTRGMWERLRELSPG